MIKISSKNKLKMTLVAMVAVLVFGVAVFLKDNSSAQENANQTEEKTVAVKVQKASEFKSSSTEIKYPATVTGDQEIRITAGVSGTATEVNFSLGDKVFTEQTLVKIDDVEGELGEEKDEFVSGQIQGLRNALEQAEEAYDQAKDTYKADKTDANKSAKEIAELQRENAKIALRAAIDARLIKAPISGTVISKEVSRGDSVSTGQLLAVVSKTDKLRIRFFVDQKNLSDIKTGMKIRVSGFQDQEEMAKIVNISPVADVETKRFLIEAVPENPKGFLIGTIVNVSFDSKEVSQKDENFILPLSAITISQNESYFFITKEGQAQKVTAEILRVSGETAEVKADISPEDSIIIEGNKLVQDGEKVEISN